MSGVATLLIEGLFRSVYGVSGEVRANMKEEAREAKAIIKAANFRMSEMSMPAGALQGGSRHLSYAQFQAGG